MVPISSRAKLKTLSRGISFICTFGALRPCPPPSGCGSPRAPRGSHGMEAGLDPCRSLTTRPKTASKVTVCPSLTNSRMPDSFLTTAAGHRAGVVVRSSSCWPPSRTRPRVCRWGQSAARRRSRRLLRAKYVRSVACTPPILSGEGWAHHF